MPKTKKTIAELKEDIANTEKQIRQGENYVKQLIQQNKQQVRSARTRRLIERGALLESMIKEADTLTNEQIKKLLQTAFNSAVVRELATALRAENAENQAAQAD